MKNIFEYTNYRLFLKDFYQEKKAREGYTYRDFARDAGMNSASWLMHLIKGNKNLSSESAKRVAKALNLNRPKTEYFELMMHFTQAKSFEAKDLYYQKMIEFKRRQKCVSINEEHYEYYSKWYHPVIRSLVTKVDWGGDYSKLAKHVLPEISTREAGKSVRLLQKLGFIKKDENGKWKQAQQAISTGDEVDSMKIINYHKQVSQLASDAHERAGDSLKDISSLTLGLSKEASYQIKTEIQAFRKKIMELAQASEGSDRVYQLNFQFFPASKQDEK